MPPLLIGKAETIPPQSPAIHSIAGPVVEGAVAQHCEGMPKKKRRRGRPPQRIPRSATERSEKERRAVVADYERWRRSVAADVDAAGAAELIGVLLDLKAEELGCVDPGMWSPQTIMELFVGLLGEQSLLTRAQVGLLQETVQSYFAFLHETNRWHSCAGSVEVASLLVGSFTISVREPHLVDRGRPGHGLVGDDVGEGLDAGLLEPAMIRSALEQIADELEELKEDLDEHDEHMDRFWSLEPGATDSEGDGDDGDRASVRLAVSVLERLDHLRAMLDRMESDLHVLAARG